MGQSEVLELLRKEKEPITVREISVKLKDNYHKISKDINKMLKYHEVFYVEIDRIQALKRFNCKRRVRLYYIKHKKQIKNGNS